MFRIRQPVSSRIFLVLGLALCVLPGCGSGGSSVTTITPARSLSQTYEGVNNAALGSYVLAGPVDTSKPLAVTVGGTPLVQGRDYFVDSADLSVIHINNALPATTPVVIQYTTLPIVQQEFPVTQTSQSVFTLVRPLNPAYPNSLSIEVHFLPHADPPSGTATSIGRLTPQDYTLTPGTQTTIRLNNPVVPPKDVFISYVPQTR